MGLTLNHVLQQIAPPSTYTSVLPKLCFRPKYQQSQLWQGHKIHTRITPIFPWPDTFQHRL